MRLILPLVLAACLAVGARPATAEDPGPGIEAVIADQIAAFGRGDVAAAFAYASPGIRSIFRTPENFGRMVREGYPMIWRPSRYEWAGLEEGPRGWVQTVLFEDGAGRLWEADYFMERAGSAWRIDGVQLRRLPGVSS